MKNKQANARLCLKIFASGLSLHWFRWFKFICLLLGADIYIQEIRLETAVLFLASMYLVVFFLLCQQDEAVNDRQHSLSKTHLGMSMLALEIKLYILEWMSSLWARLVGLLTKGSACGAGATELLFVALPCSPKTAPAPLVDAQKLLLRRGRLVRLRLLR